MMNDVPAAERTHIAFFGCRNAGKSSLVNRVTGQALAVVSPQKGTTTDPVYKTMELLPVGPVVIIDTPGADDEGTLGELRVEKMRQVLDRTDIAVLVADASAGPLGEADRQLMTEFSRRKIPYVIAWNQIDLACSDSGRPDVDGAAVLPVSALTGQGIEELKEEIGRIWKERSGASRRLAADLLAPGDLVVLVVPIDEAAPKGRLILPQQQVIRDALEAGAVPVVCRDTELSGALDSLARPPALVITDSQAFRSVAEIVPEDIPLTSFSILMARHKGYLEEALAGIEEAGRLKDGDRVLIAEGCTHHRQCNDIGTVKIPRWLAEYSGADLQIETTSGREFPEDLTPYRVVIHCGGCMLNEKEVMSRMRRAQEQGVPILNYGVLIAEMTGILARSIAPLGK